MCGIFLIFIDENYKENKAFVEKLREYYSLFEEKKEEDGEEDVKNNDKSGGGNEKPSTSSVTCSSSAEVSVEVDKSGTVTNTQTSSSGVIKLDPDDVESSLKSFLFSDIILTISDRGPDYISLTECQLGKDKDKHLFSEINKELSIKTIYESSVLEVANNLSKRLIMIDSVLNLRGGIEPTKQPLLDSKTSNILQYNGEVYSFVNGSVLQYTNESLMKENDGLILFDILNTFSLKFSGSNESDNDDDDENQLKSYASFFEGNVVSELESDHAFIFHDSVNKKMLISRDRFGKRSLLLLKCKLTGLTIVASALPTANLTNSFDIVEIPANSLTVYDYKTSVFYTHFNHSNPSSIRFNPENVPYSNTVNEDEFNLIASKTYNILKEAISKRIYSLPEFKQENLSFSISVLFSGGVDSLLIAYFSALAVKDFKRVSIDLVNLSFAKDLAPDRVTGLISYYELLKLFPEGNINLILADKSYDSDVESIKEKITTLMFPKFSHMDFNISMALHLASKLSGNLVIKDIFSEYMEKYLEDLNSKLKLEVESSSTANATTKNYNNDIISKKLEKIDYSLFAEKNTYTSKSKIIFSGLGADEFFGGYSRYKGSFTRGGANELANEMSKDINRIWMRNFGRDDRVCSANGKELRFPFFDSRLITHLKDLPLNYVTDFEMSKRGIGEKILLRKVVKLAGFEISHMFEKRAIQFGTKLARETNLKKFGSNRKANGKAQYK